MPIFNDSNLLPLVALLALSGSASAQTPPQGADLNWLAGHWCGQVEAARVEEHWLSPVGGELLGLSRTTRGGRTVDFEYLRVVQAEGEIHYVAQPRGRPPTNFKLEAVGEARARFANPHHDFPQRIEYRRDGNALTATISGPGQDGSEQTIAFEFVPCATEPDDRGR